MEQEKQSESMGRNGRRVIIFPIPLLTCQSEETCYDLKPRHAKALDMLADEVVTWLKIYRIQMQCAQGFYQRPKKAAKGLHLCPLVAVGPSISILTKCQ